MMTSLEPARTTSFHLPQHRILEEPSYNCAPPKPVNKTYTNPSTNQTVTIETDVKVHEVGILFNYEINHASKVKWEDYDPGEGKDDEDEGWVDKASSFFGGLFSKDDEEEAEEVADASEGDDSESASEYEGGANALLELEERMVSEIWKELTDGVAMSWESNADTGEWECSGYAVRDVTRQRKLSVGMDGWDDNEEENFEVAEEEDVEEDKEDNGEEDIEKDKKEDAKGGDILDEVSTSGTKLMGLTYLPLDYVNIDGCAMPAKTCTSITGQVSAAYIGTNEYGVISTVIQNLKDGMESGIFIPQGSPALNLEFTLAGGTAPSGGAGQIIPLNTARGTEIENEEEEESDLTKYGILFVCFVGILGAGFMASMYVRYKKRKMRLREAKEENIEYTAEEYEANLSMQENAMMDAEDGMMYTGKTDMEGESHETPPDSPLATMDVQKVYDDDDEPSIFDQVELDVNSPPVDSPGADSHEIEISLTGSKSWVRE